MKNKKAFTLIEILTVITIIVILMSIGVPAYNSWRNRSQIEKTKAMIAKLEMALEMYKTDNGSYPTASGNTNSLYTPLSQYITFKADEFSGTEVRDAWQEGLVYTNTNEQITIASDGADKTPNTGDEIAN